MASSARHPDPTRVAVFAKAPLPGAVKTRLIGTLGAHGAAQLHRRLVRRALHTAAAADLDGVELWCAPDADDAFLAAVGTESGATLHVQQGSDLGARMAYAFADAARRGSRLVLIGSDCPALGVEDLRIAASALGDADVVIKPAEDGGYVLVALARPLPEIFAGIAWGGDQVMRATRERAAAIGARLHELPMSWDVDRPQDVIRLDSAGLLAGISA